MREAGSLDRVAAVAAERVVEGGHLLVSVDEVVAQHVRAETFDGGLAELERLVGGRLDLGGELEGGAAGVVERLALVVAARVADPLEEEGDGAFVQPVGRGADEENGLHGRDGIG